MYKLADLRILQSRGHPLLIIHQLINLLILLMVALLAADPQLIFAKVAELFGEFTVDRQADLLHHVALGRGGLQRDCYHLFERGCVRREMGRRKCMMG
jgi:hypothetical protein